MAEDILGAAVIELKASFDKLKSDLDKARSQANSALDNIDPGEITVNADVDAALAELEGVGTAAEGIPDGDTLVTAEADAALAEVTGVGTAVAAIPDGDVLITAETSDALGGAQEVRMALDIPDETVMLKVDNSDALSATSEVKGSFDDLGSTLGAGLVGIGGAAVIKDLTLDAANLNDTVNGTNVVFREAAGTIQSFAADSDTALGLSQQATLQYSNQLGTLLQGLGYTATEASTVTIDALERANDVSSATGINRQRVVEAMISAYAGERESIKSIIGAISEEDVKQKALAMGMAATTGEISAQEKAAATHALIMEKSAMFAGDFANTQDEGLNSLARTTAGFEGLQAQMGQAFIPAMEMVMPLLRGVMDIFMALPGPVQAVIGGGVLLVATLFSLATALGPLIIGLSLTGASGGAASGGLLAAAGSALGAAGSFSLASAAGTVLGGVMAFITSPIFLVVAAIAAVIGIGYLLVKNWDTIKGAAGAVVDWVLDKWNGLKGWFDSLPDWLRNVFNPIEMIIFGPWKAAIDGIRMLWNSTIGGFGFELPSWVPGIGGKSMTIPMLAEGGEITGSGFAVVGEKGPEVVWLDRGQAVSPITDGGSVGGGGSERPIVINNHGPVGAPRDFARKMESIWGENGYGRGGRR